MALVTDTALVCRAANDAFEQAIGRRVSADGTVALLDLVAPDDREVLRRIADGTDRSTITGLMVRLTTADGEPRWAEWSVRRAGDRIYFVIRSADERVWRETLQAAEQELLASIVRGRPLRETLTLACRHFERLVPGSLCSVLLLDPSRTRFRDGAAPSLPAAYTAALHDLAIGPDVGSCGTAAHDRRVVIVEDIGRDPLWQNYCALALGHGLRACWSTPLLDGNGGVLGTFAVYHRAPHRPADRELEVAQVFTNAVAVAIERHGDQLRLVEARLGAEAANRAKSDFIAHMSHELRTPLNAILGFSDAIAADVFGAAGGERYGEYARHIHDSGRLLLGMIDGLLDLARLEAGRYELREESIAVGPLIADCVKLAAPPGTPAPAIDVRLDVGGCRLHADRQAVARILLNLLSNAIKFTPAERSVTVAARCGTDGMTIEVADRGIGIPADSLAHLGTPFHQVNAAVARAARGTGLGLSITRSLVGLHRGTLSIASTVGVGTTVTVRFPADRVEASRPAA